MLTLNDPSLNFGLIIFEDGMGWFPPGNYEEQDEETRLKFETDRKAVISISLNEFRSLGAD